MYLKQAVTCLSLALASVTIFNANILRVEASPAQRQEINAKANDWFYQGLIKVYEQDYQQAVSYFTQAIEISSSTESPNRRKKPEQLIDEALEVMKKGDYQTACQNLRSAGRIYKDKNEPREAEKVEHMIKGIAQCSIAILNHL